MDNNLFNLDNICLTRQDKEILTNISMKINYGEQLNIFGKNGSGKTSLLRILSGITSPTSGKVNATESFNACNDIFYMGHKYGLNNNLSVLENLKFYLEFNEELELNKIIDQLSHYSVVDYANTQVKYLSHGQKKIVVLSILIISNRKVWILDEPYTGLDEISTEILNNDINAQVSAGGAVIITSHRSMNIFKNWELK